MPPYGIGHLCTAQIQKFQLLHVFKRHRERPQNAVRVQVYVLQRLTPSHQLAHMRIGNLWRPGEVQKLQIGSQRRVARDQKKPTESQGVISVFDQSITAYLSEMF